MLGFIDKKPYSGVLAYLLIVIFAVFLAVLLYWGGQCYRIPRGLRADYRTTVAATRGYAGDWANVIQSRFLLAVIYQPITIKDIKNFMLDWPTMPAYVELFSVLFPGFLVILCMAFFVPYRSPLKALRGLLCGRYLRGHRHYPVQNARVASGDIVPIVVKEVMPDKSSLSSSSSTTITTLK
ncbi:unnamed protein product, partial [Mesorhabditis spiculigera]